MIDDMDEGELVRRREAAWHKQHVRWVLEDEARERRQELYRRYKWPIRVAIGFGVVLWVLMSAIAGYGVADRWTVRQPITVVIVQDHREPKQ
jgi:hypothetical protein